MEYYDEVVEIASTKRTVPEGFSSSSTSTSSSVDMADLKPIADVASVTGATKTNAPTSFAVVKDPPDDGSKPKPGAFQKLPDAPAKRQLATAAKAARGHALTDDSNNEGSDTDESSGSAAILGQTAFHVDHKDWDKLDVAADMKELFQNIMRYSPAKVHIDYVLQPFIPEFIPAVGDIDAFLKVVTPPLHNDRRGVGAFIAKLGVDTLDEPAGQQSEPALLHMKLRSMSTHIGAGTGGSGGSGGGGGGGATPASRGGTGANAKLPLVPIARQAKDVEKWIHEIQQLHISQQQAYPMALQQQQQQLLQSNSQQQRRQVADIDALMNEWPAELERALGTMGFPNAYLDCSLEFYVRMVCGLLDIGLPAAAVATQADYIYALNTLFNLYMAVKQSV